MEHCWPRSWLEFIFGPISLIYLSNVSQQVNADWCDRPWTSSKCIIEHLWLAFGFHSTKVNNNTYLLVHKTLILIALNKFEYEYMNMKLVHQTKIETTYLFDDCTKAKRVAVAMIERPI